MASHASGDSGPEPLRVKAREAVKSGRTQQALSLISAIPISEMSDEDKEFLVMTARAAYLEKQLVTYVRDAKGDRIITVVEAARILMMCREYLETVPDDPRMQKLASQCRAVVAKSESRTGAKQGSVISAAIAARFVDDSDSVNLSDFSSIETDAARILVMSGKGLGWGVLDSVKSLCPEAAAALAECKDRLSLDGIETLDYEVAKELAKHRGGELSLCGLSVLSRGVAEALASHGGSGLSLGGLTTLSDEVAVALSRYKGTLELESITEMTVSVASALVRHEGELCLGSLGSPSDEVCRTLEGKARLKLDAVISPRLRALEKAIKAATPVDVLAVLQDFEARERLDAEDHPDIPGGYSGPAEKAALGGMSVAKDGDAWLCKLTVMEMGEGFPCEELRTVAQNLVDTCPEGAAVKVTVERDTPGTDSDCEYFYGHDMYGDADDGGDDDEDAESEDEDDDSKTD
jgi:hypothetical protein